MRKTWIHNAASMGLGLLTLAGVANAQQAAAPARPAGGNAPAAVDLPGPIDSPKDLQDTGKFAFKMADTNNDNQISQQEATDLLNTMVGGFFFRADANGDGSLTKEEAQQARDSFLQQKPLLRVFAREWKRLGQAQPGQPNQNQAQNSSPLQGLADLLDGNNDKKLGASEVRQAVKTAVEGLYSAADSNRDGQMSPSEINAAVVGLGRSVVQTAFQAADTDNDKALSIQEYDKAIIQPARLLFMMADANDDNKLTPEEARRAEQLVAQQLQMLRVPEPANSLGHALQAQGRPASGENAPVPNFGTPNTPNRPAAPAGNPPR